MLNNSHTRPLSTIEAEDLSARMLATSIILSAYEIIKSMVIPRTKFSLLTGSGYGGDQHSDKYETDVLSRHLSPLNASVKYLAEHYEAIQDEDVDQIIALRNLRNQIGHELPKVIVEFESAVLFEHVRLARKLVFKLDNFWMYIEIGCDPEHSDTDWDTAYSNSTMFIDHLIGLTDRLQLPSVGSK